MLLDLICYVVSFYLIFAFIEEENKTRTTKINAFLNQDKCTRYTNIQIHTSIQIY